MVVQAPCQKWMWHFWSFADDCNVPLVFCCPPHRPLTRFQGLGGGQNTFYGGKIFFNNMFNKKFSGHNKIWGAQKSFGGALLPNAPPWRRVCPHSTNTWRAAWAKDACLPIKHKVCFNVAATIYFLIESSNVYVFFFWISEKVAPLCRLAPGLSTSTWRRHFSRAWWCRTSPQSNLFNKNCRIPSTFLRGFQSAWEKLSICWKRRKWVNLTPHVALQHAASPKCHLSPCCGWHEFT